MAHFTVSLMEFVKSISWVILFLKLWVLMIRFKSMIRVRWLMSIAEPSFFMIVTRWKALVSERSLSLSTTRLVVLAWYGVSIAAKMLRKFKLPSVPILKLFSSSPSTLVGCTGCMSMLHLHIKWKLQKIKMSSCSAFVLPYQLYPNDQK